MEHSSGAINVILKRRNVTPDSATGKRRNTGNSFRMYLFPSYSVNYAYNKLNLYTSYNGEICYLNLMRNISGNRSFNDTTVISSDQYVTQKNWSNRFNYGFDYFLRPNDQFNFYAFYNPFSRELDGIAELITSDSSNNSWKAQKEDTDKNPSTLYSLYYKHDFE